MSKTPQTCDPGSDSAVLLLQKLLSETASANASDLHLQQMEDGSVSVAARLDGVLNPLPPIDSRTAERLFGRIKFLANMKTYQNNYPQDGRISAKDAGLGKDVRVSSYPTVDGEKIVMRFFQKTTVSGVGELGLSPEKEKRISSFLKKKSGMLLLTGPAGSGKTTTIYACLNELAGSGGRNIVTIEDPVEQKIPGIMQTEVNASIGLNFPEALRHLLRQDPEVIVIGEIRDEETAKIAVRTAFTGHMVIATLHAGSCKGVIERLMDMCEDKYAVLSSVDLILNQRLVRKKCPDCKGRECPLCLGSGYHGRIPVLEMLELNDDLRSRIRNEGTDILGNPDALRQDAQRLVDNNITDTAELGRLI